MTIFVIIFAASIIIITLIANYCRAIISGQCFAAMIYLQAARVLKRYYLHFVIITACSFICTKKIYTAIFDISFKPPGIRPRAVAAYTFLF